MRRIVVVGTSGSGKSTLARELARILRITHIELDALHWGPNWTPRADFVQRVEDVIGGEAWVIDGNYSGMRPKIWAAADAIMWLDYPMAVPLVRVTRRTFGRWWRGDVLWAGNRERLWDQFCTRDSLYLWLMQQWRAYRRDYPGRLRAAANQGKRIIRLRSPRQTEKWLMSMQGKAPSRDFSAAECSEQPGKP